MAGDWIKMRSNLWDDPRVSGIADSTKSKEATIIGGLYWLWAMADQHTGDGFLPGLTASAIDRKTGIKGFGESLVAVGWLIENKGGVTIPHFEEHNGASAKERAQTAKRVANHKAKSNGKVTVSALPNCGKTNGQTVTSALPREREEKSKPLSVNSVSVNDTVGTPAGTVCALLKKSGILDVNPSHPKLLALLEGGITTDEIASIGPEAKSKGKGFAWILAAVEGRRRDAAQVAVAQKSEKPWYLSSSGIEKEGARLGIERGDDLFPYFKTRVFKAAGVTDDMVRSAQAEFR